VAIDSIPSQSESDAYNWGIRPWEPEGFEVVTSNFGDLTAVQELMISDCGLLTLPCSIQHLTARNTLKLQFLQHFTKFPSSFGNLKSLRKLTLDQLYPLNVLPATFGDLALENLTIDQCEFKELPDICSLTTLQTLDLTEVDRLEKLPINFGALSNITELKVECDYHFDHQFGSDKFKDLPQSFGHLISLQQLTLSNLQSIEKLPLTFGELTMLGILIIQNCRNLKELPATFRQLTALYQLNSRKWSRRLASEHSRGSNAWKSVDTVGCTLSPVSKHSRAFKR